MEAVQEGDDLHVEVGVSRCPGLQADLVVLAVATRLGALVAEVGSDVPGLPGGRGTMLHEGPHQPEAVPPGAGPSSSPPLSSKSYISLRTMSVESPTRSNTSTCSMSGVRARPKPANRACS